MPKRTDLHVISGGKSGDREASSHPSAADDCARLLQKADHYRDLAASKPSKEVTNLISDLADAIRALCLLEQSNEVAAQQRALEYRRLVAELEIEIVSTLNAP